MTHSTSVYEEELARMETPARGSSGSGGDFLEIEKPAQTGTKTYRLVRVVPRLPWIDRGDGAGRVPDPENPHRQFWMRVAAHKVQGPDGKWISAICPEDQDVPGWRDRATCPVCLLQKELWAAKRDDWDAVAKNIRAQRRIYCNVIDLDDINSHWTEDGNGGWRVHPKIFGYSSSVHKDLLAACIHNGPIEDVTVGRPIVIQCERIGPKKNDIRYSIVTKDREPLPEELLPIAQGAWDLEGLAKPASMEDLRKFAAAVDPRPASASGSYSRPAAPAPAPTATTHVGPPRTMTAAASAPPPPAAAPPAPAPVTPPAPAPTPAVTYHYAGPDGQASGLSPADIAAKVAAAPGEQHLVWRDGMAGWSDAAQQPDIAPLLRPAAPPAPVAGPPVPPAPPPRPGASSSQPRGGYPVDTPAAVPATGGPPRPPGGPPGGPAF